MRRKKKLSFEEWIDETGIDVLAKNLKVSVQTVWNWKAGRSDPRAKYLRRIKRDTQGDITYEMMLDRPCITSRGAR